MSTTPTTRVAVLTSRTAMQDGTYPQLVVNEDDWYRIVGFVNRDYKSFVGLEPRFTAAQTLSIMGALDIAIFTVRKRGRPRTRPTWEPDGPTDAEIVTGFPALDQAEKALCRRVLNWLDTYSRKDGFTFEFERRPEPDEAPA